MAGPGPTLTIPRWVQLVGLPVLLVLGFLLASTLGHVLFLFLTGSVIAFMLNPLVRDLGVASCASGQLSRASRRSLRLASVLAG
jgi:predicted PurR-regulated permease PerM